MFQEVILFWNRHLKFISFSSTLDFEFLMPLSWHLRHIQTVLDRKKKKDKLILNTLSVQYSHASSHRHYTDCMLSTHENSMSSGRFEELWQSQINFIPLGVYKKSIHVALFFTCVARKTLLMKSILVRRCSSVQHCEHLSSASKYAY